MKISDTVVTMAKLAAAPSVHHEAVAAAAGTGGVGIAKRKRSVARHRAMRTIPPRLAMRLKDLQDRSGGTVAPAPTLKMPISGSWSHLSHAATTKTKVPQCVTEALSLSKEGRRWEQVPIQKQPERSTCSGRDEKELE
jgi:hypothetical protein